MTNLEPITKNQLDRIAELESERDTGINKNGNKVKWDGTTKPAELSELITKRDSPAELPQGAKSFLDEVFRDVFWNRKRIISGKPFEKGLMTEEDVLDIHSKIDGAFYKKNEEMLENDYTTGIPDNRQGKIRDAKSCNDLESFDNASLTSDYKWQVKNYMILDKKSEGEVCFGLVNAPLHILQNSETSLFYQFGRPDDDNEKYIEALKLNERNHIFDIDLWKRDYPFYHFRNNNLNFSIPYQLRAKKFHVTLEPDDEINIATRVTMARIYLCEKEREVYEKLKQIKP